MGDVNDELDQLDNVLGSNQPIQNSENSNLEGLLSVSEGAGLDWVAASKEEKKK